MKLGVWLDYAMLLVIVPNSVIELVSCDCMSSLNCFNKVEQYILLQSATSMLTKCVKYYNCSGIYQKPGIKKCNEAFSKY